MSMLIKRMSHILTFLYAFSASAMLGVLADKRIIQSTDLHQRLPLNPNDLNNVAARINHAQSLQDKEFLDTMENALLELQQVGFYNFITNFVSQTKSGNGSGNSLKAGFQDGRGLSGKAFNVRGFLQQLVENSTVSPACANDTGRMLLAIVKREKWIVPFLDSVGKPGPSLTLIRLKFVGNYEQCRSSMAPPDPFMRTRGFKGNYCDVGATFKGQNSPQPVGISWGVCVPDTCAPEDLMLLTVGVLEMANATTKLDPTPPDCHTEEREVTVATIVAIVLLSLIGLMMLLGTTYDLLVIQGPQWRGFGPEKPVFNESVPPMDQAVPSTNGEYNRDNGNAYGVPEQSEATPLIPKSVEISDQEPRAVVKVLLAFSIYSNAKKVLNTKQPPGSLTAIHGIRFLSMSWVVLGHVYAMLMPFSGNMIENIPVVLKRWSMDAISNAFPSVDTFFALSGLLTSYLTIREMRRKSWKINWGLFYFHRFWRLTPPYMLALVIALGLQRFMGSGALWATVQPSDKEFCERNWWTNLLYVNNLVRTKEPCFAHSWYLANDMQFFIISPLMLIPFYFHRLAGFASCGLFLLTTMITTGALSTHYQWGATLVSLKPVGTFGIWFIDYYIKPWCRIGPFVVGIMAGYLLAVTNGGRYIRMKWWIVVTGWVVAVASGLAVVYGLHGEISGDDVPSVGAMALYNAVARSVWGACVCWVIVACAAGYGGPVNALLSWTPFVFLGRLTYMTYLIHLSIVDSYFANRDGLFYFNNANVTITFIGLLFFINMVSFVAMLALESPMIGLEKAFIRKERRD